MRIVLTVTAFLAAFSLSACAERHLLDVCPHGVRVEMPTMVLPGMQRQVTETRCRLPGDDDQPVVVPLAPEPAVKKGAEL